MKLNFECDTPACSRINTGFFNTPKFPGKCSYKINMLSNLTMRVIGRGRSAALKLFSILNIRNPVGKQAWSQYTNLLLSKVQKVSEKNMKQAADELYDMNIRSNESVADAGVSLDCSWNSRGWQAKGGVVAAISQDTGKIIDIVHKTLYCRECSNKQSQRDDHKISALEYMEWFIGQDHAAI